MTVQNGEEIISGGSGVDVTELEEISRKFLGFDLQETCSGQDFREVAVWNVRKALEAAYLAGASRFGGKLDHD